MLASGTIALMTDGDAAHFLALDLAATRVQVADDVADVIFRRHDLDLHDRLEQLGAGFAGSFLETGARGDFEGQDRGVNVVVTRRRSASP